MSTERLRFIEAKSLPPRNGQVRVILRTSGGDIQGILHRAGGKSGIVWACGALGGFDGPSFGIFATLSEELVVSNITSLRLNYRYPGEFAECVLDVVVGVEYLKKEGMDNIALVGHSFGGAVVIQAGTMSPAVKAVVGLSSQTFGAQNVAGVAPRPLLLIHGERDRNLSVRCSQLIYQWAGEPKDLVIYKDCGHFLRECHNEMHDLMKRWLLDKLGQTPPKT